MKRPNIPNPLRNSLWFALHLERECRVHGFPQRAKAFLNYRKRNHCKERVEYRRSIRKNKTRAYAAKPRDLVNLLYSPTFRKRTIFPYAALAHSSHTLHIRKVIQTFGLFSYKPYNERKFLK